MKVTIQLPEIKVEKQPAVQSKSGSSSQGRKLHYSSKKAQKNVTRTIESARANSSQYGRKLLTGVFTSGVTVFGEGANLAINTGFDVLDLGIRTIFRAARGVNNVFSAGIDAARKTK